MDINKKVLLLAILKKEEDETINDVVSKLENTNLFSLKEGKRLLKELKKDEFIINNILSLKGNLTAKDIEKEFQI